MKKLLLLIFLFCSFSSYAQFKGGHKVKATKELIAKDKFIWQNDEIYKDSLTYAELTKDSIRFKHINGDWTNWFARHDSMTIDRGSTRLAEIHYPQVLDLSQLDSRLSDDEDWLADLDDMVYDLFDSIYNHNTRLISLENKNYQTNLNYTSATNQGKVTCDTGNDAVIPLATTQLAGLMSPDDKNKLSSPLIQEFNSWRIIGTSLQFPDLAETRITTLNGTDIAFIDRVNSELKTYRYTNNQWEQIGNTLNLPTAGFTALTALNETDVAVYLGAQFTLSTYRFDGTNWSQVGNSLNVINKKCWSITAMNTFDIAYLDITGDAIITFRFDGSNWTQQPGSYSLPNKTGYLTKLSDNRVVFLNTTDDEMTTFWYNGEVWNTVGESLSINADAITNLTATEIAAVSIAGTLSLYEYDQGYWSLKGTIFNVGSNSLPTITALNTTDVAFFDGTNSQLRVYQYNRNPLLNYWSKQEITQENTLLWSNKLDTVFHDNTLDGRGTVNDPLGINSSALPSTFDDLGDGTTNKAYSLTEKNKLASIAGGAEVNVNADWNASNGDALILNKPTMAAVATSGSYNDLKDKPTIPNSNFSGCVAYTSNSGTITNSVAEIEFDSEKHDTDDYHSISSNKNRFYVPLDGYYSFQFSIQMKTGAVFNYINFYYTINGAYNYLPNFTFNQDEAWPSGVDQGFVLPEITVYLNQGDFVGIGVFINTANAGSYGNAHKAWFQIKKE